MLAHLSKDFAGDHDRRAVEIHPGRLWSLWDMLKFNAAPFYEITQLLRTFRSNVEAQKDTDPNFYKKSIKADIIGGKSAIKTFVDGADRLKILFEELGTRVTLLVVEDLRKALKENYYLSLEDVAKFYEEIDTTLRRELSLVPMLSLNVTEQAYFESAEPRFGPDFESRFQTAGAFELDEAAKCIALSRPTAAVFHLMRLMEIGIRSVAKCLSIPDPLKPAERNWGNILKAIKSDLDAHSGPSPSKAWANPADREIFESAYTSLDAVRVGWRNTTMHVENKYTDDEAQHIYFAVKGFMKKLASRCDEEGKPLA